jgi:SAM-dependent methyltransferase
MFGDATRLPFADDMFDLVLAIEVLEHVPDPDRALRELRRVGTSTLIASVPFEPVWRIGNMVRGRYLRDLGNTPGHVNHWTRWGFTRFVGNRFDVVDTVSPVPWTMVLAHVPGTPPEAG